MAIIRTEERKNVLSYNLQFLASRVLDGRPFTMDNDPLTIYAIIDGIATYYQAKTGRMNRCLENIEGINGGMMAIAYAPMKLSNAISVDLTPNELAVLESLDKTFRWIVRDINGDLIISEERPEFISRGEWSVPWFENISFFNHLFKDITEDCNEPFNIAGLIEEAKNRNKGENDE